MDAYVNYIKSLLAQGTDTATIKGDLLARGVSVDKAEELLAVAATTNSTALGHSNSTWLHRATQQAPATVPNTPEKRVTFITGYIITLLLCLIPTLIILFVAGASGYFSTADKTLLIIGDVAGVIGLCLYVVDMVLATRLTWLEDMFGGLNKVYIAHAIIGGSALMAILIHPVILVVNYLPENVHAAADFFLPSLINLPRTYGILGLLLTLVLLAITLYAHLPYRLWLFTHKFLGLAYLLICLHVLYAPNIITSNAFVRFYLLTLIVIGFLAFIYRTILPNVLVHRYVYIVKTATPKTTGVIEITLMPTTKVMHFRPGQFVFISFHADGLSPEWHPFSIVSVPSDGSFSVDVKSLGAYTETMTRILPDMEGMTAYVEGAYGRFSFHNLKNTNQVWIAGGIGITPFVSMAQSLSSAGTFNIDLYYSVKSKAELIDIDLLARQQLSKPGQTFRVLPFVADEYQKFLSADMIAKNSGDLTQRDFLICGPPAMMSALKKQLTATGVKSYKIHTEEFSIL